MKDCSKVSKKHFWMIQSVKNEVFGHYLEFGQLDWLDVEYDDRTICISPFSNTTRWWRIIQQSQKSIFEWSKVPKMRFLAIILSLVSWIDLILHIVKVLNAPAHFGNGSRPCRIIKRLQKCIWNDPNILKGGLRPFSQAWSVRLTW